jgi:5-methylcytosine-specific restriction endonuclease McrA
MSVLDNLVLILNTGWTPIRVKNIKTAIKLLFRERACVVDPFNYEVFNWDKWVNQKITDGEPYIQAVRFKVKAPEIIVLTQYHKTPNYNVRLTKRNIFIRDKYYCQYSGEILSKKNADIDHIIPKSKGGKNTWDNLVATSKAINRKKGDKTPEEAGLKLVKKPVKPSNSALLFDPRKKIPESWKKFIK